MGGNINIESQRELVVNNGAIESTSRGSLIGKGGNIHVNARFIEFNNSTLYSQTDSNADTGDITINTDLLRLNNGAQIFNVTLGEGNGGNIAINASSIALNGADVNGFPSGLLAQTLGKGNAGDIKINTDLLRLNNGAQIFSITLRAEGSAGNLIIHARDLQLIGSNPVNGDPSGLFTTTEEGEGNGGDLRINTDSLRLDGGAQILTGTRGKGNGGNLTINAKDISLNGVNANSDFSSGLFTETQGEGNAGDLRIETDSLHLDGGAQISAGTRDRGNGGNLTINAKAIELIGIDPVDGSTSSALETATRGEGNAGELTITTQDLLISDRATISAGSSETGSSGNINLFADNIRIQNNGRIGVFSTGTGRSGNIIISGNTIALDRSIIDTESNRGRGGNINITLTENLTLTNESLITARAGVDRVGTGDGGNITIESPLIIAQSRDNLITADAFGGTGGNINITTNAILGYPQFLRITASSELGIDGTIIIQGLSDDIRRGELLTLTPAIDAEAILANDVCAVKDGEVAGGSSFTIPGKGGITPNPLEHLERSRGIVEWSERPFGEAKISKNNSRSETAKTPPKPKKLQPAVGWYRRTDGTVVLTSNPALVRPLNKPIDYPDGCDK